MSQQDLDQDLPWVFPDIVDMDDGGRLVLAGAWCPRCGRHAFPAAPACMGCGAATEPKRLGDRGSLHSHTTVRVHPPYGLPNPYTVGLVDLDAVPLRVFALLDPDAPQPFHIGQPLELAVARVGHDGQGNPCLRPIFRPRTELAR